MPKVGAETETEEQQETEDKRRHMAVYVAALDSDVCVSDACVCTIHEHHAEARAALMREASMHDWTKQTGPGMNGDRVRQDWNASLHVYGLGSAVHTWS